MEFHVLGPLEAFDESASVPLGGRRQRAVLARLLLDADRPVSVERLVDDLWGRDVPETAVKMIQIAVSQLRKVLPPGVVETRAAGYAIALGDTHTLDLHRHEALREAAAAARSAGDLEAASAALASARALWRGAALAEFSEPFARTEGARLEELRLVCTEEWIEIELALGRGHGLTGELEALVAQHPLRERLREALMRALYAAGRQAEALEAFRAFRQTLADWLGIEPSPRLRELQGRILRQDPALDARVQATPAAQPEPSRRVSSRRRTASMEPPRYVRSGEASIAYQVVGSGPLDIVLVHGWVCTFSASWERPAIARFYERLAGMGRLILFDKRGTGLSDRVLGIATLEERMDDVRAVMDAVASERAVIIGVSEGGPMSVLFAATHPERTAALVLLGSFARRMRAPDYPAGMTPERWEQVNGWRDEEWGAAVSKVWLDRVAPSLRGDLDAQRWYASWVVRGASPGAGRQLAVMNRDIDVRDALPSIHLPTLVVYRAGEEYREATRHMGERIVGARIVELPGDDHLPWEGDADALLGEIERFVTTLHDGPVSELVLTTLLVAELDTSESDPEQAGALVRAQLSQHRGVEVREMGGHVFARFDAPARAVRCARAIVEGAGSLGLDARASVHTGECEIVRGRPQGDTVAIAHALLEQSAGGQVLVSSTVRDLAGGSGLDFSERGVLHATGPERRVFAAGASG